MFNIPLCSIYILVTNTKKMTSQAEAELNALQTQREALTSRESGRELLRARKQEINLANYAAVFSDRFVNHFIELIEAYLSANNGNLRPNQRNRITRQIRSGRANVVSSWMLPGTDPPEVTRSDIFGHMFDNLAPETSGLTHFQT